ncbi:hypothetical protein [Sphingomonas sp.]|uniref:hypothetical protein n=1 Tax=Sphingomonas sp. TaxID=28214 RepID=UPI0025F1659E|nr:hypothetical protein [Sphingomonas sp.]
MRQLNLAARNRLRNAGELGQEFAVQTGRGERVFAAGDRVMFLHNERGLGVKNGSRGIVESVNQVRMAVLLDDGRSIAFDLKDYAQVDHGYAATVHKAQGMTVDRVHVLATPGLDRHAAYVGLSRHRAGVGLHYGRDDFADQDRLAATLGRERGKDMASDYPLPAQVSEKAPEPPRNPFAGLRLGVARATDEPERSPLARAVERYARAMLDIERLGRRGDPLPHQAAALRTARDGVNAIRPLASRDLASAFGADPQLMEEAARGRPAAAIQAMQLEAEIRVDAAQRADRFVAEWQKETLRWQGYRQNGDVVRAEHTVDRMRDMAKDLQRDPQLESLLRNRRIELGLKASGGQGLSHDLQDHSALSRGRGLGR